MLVIPVNYLIVARAEDCALGTDIVISALSDDAPKSLSVSRFALRDFENIAYLLDDIVFAVVVGQSGIKIGQCAGEVYKLITAHFVKLDAAANLFGDNARRLTDALNGLRNADISEHCS